MEPASTYPLNLSVDYPDRQLNRLTTFFRIFVAIPILVVLGTVSGASWSGRARAAGLAPRRAPAGCCSSGRC